MKGKILLIIAIVVVIGLGIYAWYNYYNQPVFENDWESTDTMADGKWQVDVIINYADGTHTTIQQLSDNQALTVTYEGQKIESLEYVAGALAYGTGFETCLLNLNNYDVITTVYNPSGVGVFSATQSDYLITELPVYEPAMGPWAWNLYTNISRSLIPIAQLSQDNNYPSGTYDIMFKPAGTISYQGLRADGSSGPITTLSTLPITGIVSVDIEADSITIQFSSTINYYT